MKTGFHSYLWIIAIALFSGLSAQAVDIAMSWDAPTLSENDEPLADICGYQLCYGTEPGIFTHSLDVGSTPAATVTGLMRGVTYYFAVKACTSCRNESSLSVELVWTAPVLMDADRDFLDDNWELAVFQSLDSSRGGDQDSDLDGATDYDEFIAGTMPDDPGSAPMLVTTFANGQRTVVFFAKSAQGSGYENRARYYTLETCSNLHQGQWQPVPGLINIPGSDEALTYSIPSASGAYFKTTIRLD